MSCSYGTVFMLELNCNLHLHTLTHFQNTVVRAHLQLEMLISYKNDNTM